MHPTVTSQYLIKAAAKAEEILQSVAVPKDLKRERVTYQSRVITCAPVLNLIPCNIFHCSFQAKLQYMP